MPVASGQAARGRLFLVAVLLLSSTAFGMIWLAGTEVALRWVAAKAQAASGGRLSLQDVRGSLYTEIRAASMKFEDAGRRFEVREVALNWSPIDLVLRRMLHIRSLSAQSVVADLGSGDRQPITLPDTLRIALKVEIATKVDTLEVIMDGVSTRFQSVVMGLSSGDRNYQTRASASTPWGSADMHLTLANTAPFALAGRASLLREGAKEAHSVSASFEGTLAEIEMLARLRLRGVQAEIVAALAPFEETPWRQAQLRVSGVDARTLRSGFPRTDIGVQANLRPRGTGGVQGELRITNAAPGSLDASLLPIREVRASFEGNPGALALQGLHLDLGEAGRFSGAGSFANGRLDLALDTSRMDMHGLHARLAVTNLAGNLRVGLTDGLQEIAADLREGGYRLQLDASHRADTIAVRAAKVAIGDGEFEFSGRLSLGQAREFRADGSFSRFDPSRLGEYPAALLNGSFSAHGQLASSPQAALQVALGESRFRGHRLKGKGRLNFSAERIWDSDIALELGANRLFARGAYGVGADLMQWRIDGADLAVLAPQLEGSIKASGTLRGTFDEPAGAFNVAVRNLAWSGKHRVSRLIFAGGAEQGRDGPLTLSGQLREYRSGSMRIDAASVKVKGRRSDHELNFTALNDAFDVRASITGRWGAGRVWSGRIESLENRGRHAAVLQGPVAVEVNSTTVSLGAAAVRFARGEVRIDEIVRRDGAMFSSGTLTGIDSAYLLGLLGGFPDFSSTLRMGGRWTVALEDRLNAQLELARESGDLTFESRPPIAAGLDRLAMAASVVEGRLSATLQAAGSVLGTVSLEVKSAFERRGALIGVSENAPIELEARVNTPSLAWASALLGRRLSIDGSLSGQISGHGTLAEPRFSGSLSADGLRFEYPGQGIYLKDGLLRAVMRGAQLRIERFSLHGGQGVVEGSGSISYGNGAASVEIELHAKELELIKRLDRHVVLSGKAQAGMNEGALRAIAVLRADKGEIALPEADAPTLSADVIVVNQAGVAEEKRSSRIASDLEVTLDLGEQFKLKGRGLDALLAGKIALRATSRAPPTASGSIRVVQGHYAAYGRRLVIDRGVLNFAGPLDDPGLDIVALRKQQAVEAGVAIRGTALTPQVSLVSNPVVPDSEKLSWLILGRSTDGVNRAEFNLLQAAAGTLLARGESLMLQNRIAHAAGLDEFALSGGGRLESTVLTLGKRLSSRAYLTFEQGLATATNLVKMHYSLTPRLSVRAQTGSENALDAFYTFSFE